MLPGMSWLQRLGFVPPSASQGDDEHSLLAQLRAGSSQALTRLYRRESPAVYRYALGLSGNEALALDAMQEAFSQLLAQPQAYDPARGSLGAYLAGMARHHLLARWRDAARWQALPTAMDGDSDGDTPDDTGPAAPGSDTLLVRRQSDAALWAAIRRLTWTQREALVLVDLQERSYAEAAAIAGVSLDVLRTRLHRARSNLAHSLNDPELT